MITLVKQLLDSARPGDVCRDSFRNYHAVGLDYLCLLRTTRLTVKLYFFRADRQTTNVYWKGVDCTTPTLVWPHNHRYAFEHTTIEGEIANLRFTLSEGLTHDVLAYDASTRRTTRIGRAGLKVKCVERGPHFAMPNRDELHTIAIVSKTAFAAQVQYHDDDRQQTMLVTEPGEVLQNPALYARPDATVVTAWIAEAREALR